MLGDYIKRLTDKGYKISFENPIEEADWMCIKISKKGDLNKAVLPIENMLLKTIENIVGTRVLEL